METSAPFNKYITLTNYLLLVTILLSGDTFAKVCTIFCRYFCAVDFAAILGMNIGSANYFHRTVVPDVDHAAERVLKKFLKRCREQVSDRDNVRYFSIVYLHHFVHFLT